MDGKAATVNTLSNGGHGRPAGWSTEIDANVGVGTPAPLTRERVLTTAVALADQGGDRLAEHAGAGAGAGRRPDGALPARG